jgi:hypothetical protein
MNRAEHRAAWRARHRSLSEPLPVPAPAPLAPDIRFEIREIVLHGLPRLNRHDLAEGVHAAMTQSLVTDGLPPHFERLNRASQVQGGPISVDLGARPAAVGRQIAGAILGASSP